VVEGVRGVVQHQQGGDLGEWQEQGGGARDGRHQE
jgi:hypothetical protein